MNVPTLSAKFFLYRMVGHCFVPFICSLAMAFTPTISLAVGVESARKDLEKIFGTPDTFAQKFEEDVKEKSDAVVGLLTAAAGFGYVVKVFL
jgi:hypothetical protein